MTIESIRIKPGTSISTLQIHDDKLQVKMILLYIIGHNIKKLLYTEESKQY